jgi:hypothetical protein
MSQRNSAHRYGTVPEFATSVAPDRQPNRPGPFLGASMRLFSFRAKNYCAGRIIKSPYRGEA